MSIGHLIGREELMAFLDGEVAPPRAAIIRAHAEACGECAAAIEEWRALSASLRDWRVEPAPLTLNPRENGGASAAVPLTARRARPPLWRVAPWLAAAAAVVLVGSWWLDEGGVGHQATLSMPGDEAAPGDLGRDRFNGMQVVTRGGDDAVKKGPAAGDLAPMQAPPPAVPAPPPPAMSALPLAALAQKTADPVMLVRTATLGLSTEQFDEMLTRLQAVAERHGGSVSTYQLSGDRANGRALSATVRVPVALMDVALSELRRLGTVTAESEATEEITDAHRDLAIRIENAKREAARLNELLTRDSDRLGDVLQVEQAQARVQTEIEQMTAEEAAMRGRATMAAIAVSVGEVRHAHLALGPLPLRTRIRNALIDGTRAAGESVVAVCLLLADTVPSLLLWIALLTPVAVLVRFVASLVRRRWPARS